jgi:glycosyltransferase involved in cell wall biosynthesis
LITVSRLAPNKRIHHAVQTLAELKRRGVAAHLTIVGGGETRGLIEATVKECGIADSVKLTGPLSEAEKDALLRESHFLLHQSQREGWGLNVIEANAMGTPAAVYPVAGLIESTLDNRTGIVAREETPESLAERIMEAMVQPEAYEGWRRSAWERAKTMHWNHILPLAADWLESVARGQAHVAGPIPAI